MDPLLIPIASSTTDDVNLFVDNDEFAYIGQNIRFASLEDNAIEVESRTTVQLDGQAVGVVGYFAEGDDNSLSVGAHGVAWGSLAGIEALGLNNFIDNAGLVYGGVAGVAVLGSGELHNSGTILAGTHNLEINAAIFIEEGPDGPGSQLIANSGTVATQLSTGFSILSLGAVAERISNTGHITGQVFLDAGNDLLDTTGGTLVGTIDMGAGNDTVKGSAGADIVFGGAGNDQLFGNGGNDQLRGDAGVDLLTGGAGADRFIFRASDSGKTASTEDRVTDFSHTQHDRIDLHLVDANTRLTADQAFTFIGTKAFTHHAGELHYSVSGGNAFVSGDADGNGVADFTLRLDHVTSLVAGDFLL